MPDRLSGPVDVCVAVPRLSVDRPFTYLLRADQDAGVGSLVSVPFHGRTVKGWVLGPATVAPAGRLLAVRTVRSGVRFFDEAMIDLLRWVSGRYLAPLATVIERSHPPRVASEEEGKEEASSPALPRPSQAARAPVLDRYGGARQLLEAGTTTWLRPLPREEADACVAGVVACLESGRRALVLVPEAEPVPHTARAVLDAFGDRATGFLGGDRRERYRTWLDIRAGRFEAVVATRPGVFAPLPDLGLVWISREVHPGHREDRAPYYHVRDVAMARAAIHQASCVLASLSPSVATASAASTGAVRTARAARGTERAAAPLVEATPSEAEDRSARLGRLLKEATSAALIVSRSGYGVARVCRRCGEPATCAACSGPIVVEEGTLACRSCGAPGRCAHCGGSSFGVERGGAERVAEWAGRIAARPVQVEGTSASPPVPGPGRLTVGTAASVKDVGPLDLDLVAVLDPDRALARAGVQAGEQALATWMEAAAWARPRARGGRVLVQTRRPGHPALQALVRWDPVTFLRGEAARRAEAGFPPGHHVFRVEGQRPAPGALEGLGSGLEEALRAAGAATVVTTMRADRTVHLVAVAPAEADRFRRTVVGLAVDGAVTRVEAEPHL